MRRLRPTGIAAIAVVVLLVASATGTAIAYFTTTGGGKSQPKTVAVLSAPSIATATPGIGGIVSLSWDAVAAPGPGTVTYKVERDGGGAAGTCISALAVTTCVDTGLLVGTYDYTVTAKWRSWTVTGSSREATVTVGPVDHLTLGAASSTPTAGAADNLTITAKDASGGTVTSYAGPRSLTFGGAAASPGGTAPTILDSAGDAVAFGDPTTIDFSAGVASVSGGKNGVMRLYRAGSTSLEVSDGSLATATPLALTVGAATASAFALAAESTAIEAGVADALTIAAQDAYGNVATGYNGSKNLVFSGAAASPSGKKPTVSNSSGSSVNFGSTTAIGFSAGVATVSSATKNGVMTLYGSGDADIEASEGSISTETPLAVSVAPTAASKLVLAAASTTPAPGAADALTITAQDAYGNVATGYGGPKVLTFSGAAASPDGRTPTVANAAGADIAFGDPTAISFDAGVATVTGGKNGTMRLYKSGSTSIGVSDGSLSSAALVVNVTTAATKLRLAASTTAPAAGASVNLTITALDDFENTVTSYAGAKSLVFSGAATSPENNKPTVSSSSGSNIAFGSSTSISFTAGVAAITSSTRNGVMKLYSAAETNVDVSDGTISTGTPLALTVSSGAASKLVLAASTSAPTAGAANNLTLTAKDSYGNPAAAYDGTKNITFSGPAASPDGTTPTVSSSSGSAIAIGTATPIAFDAGVAAVEGGKNGVLKAYKSGSVNVKASDGTFTTANVALTVAPTPAAEFLLASSATTLTAGGTANLTTTALDAYGNTDTNYTGAHNLTYSGASASPNATAPTVVNNNTTAVAFGSATAITFSAGVAKVGSSKNGVVRLYRAEAASLSVSDGTVSNPTPVTITVSPTSASRWALTNINHSAGSLGSTCLFTCTLTGLGNGGTVKARVAVADTYGNTVQNVGSGHSAKVAVTSGSGSISGSPLTIPSTGAAETASTFTFTSKSSGNFTETVTVSAAAGTAYTNATLTASR